MLHDLQQPIAVLRLLLEVLPDATLRRRQLQRLRDAALNEISSMQRLLSAELDAGSGECIASSPIACAAVPERDGATSFDAVVRAVVGPFREAGGHVVLTCVDEIVVALPPLPLRRVVSNVVHNAVRAAGQPNGQVLVELRRVGGTAVLLIDDTGPGFGAIATGHGLGLLNSVTVLFRYGGSLQIGPSRVGGTRIRISLPVVGS